MMLSPVDSARYDVCGSGVMFDTHEAVLDDTNRRSCERVSRAKGGCNNGHDLLSSLIYIALESRL